METYRIHHDSDVYFVTFTVTEWLPVFVNEAACRIVTESLQYCHVNMGLRINAYVIMPTHVHGIFFADDFEPQRLSAALTSFRKFTGRALCEYAAEHLPPAFSQVFAASATDRTRRFWQASRHPVGLPNREVWAQKSDYLHENPRRKGLVLYPEHWRFSSARYYLDAGGRKDQDVTITELEW